MQTDKLTYTDTQTYSTSYIFKHYILTYMCSSWRGGVREQEVQFDN